MRSTAGESSNFRVDVVLHHGSALSPLFMMVMDVLTIKESEKEVPELMMFADDV